jgi:hypothetical protein
MPKKSTILFDLSHGEMFDFEESEYHDFLSLLKSIGLNVKENRNKSLSNKILNNIDILIIGNPIEEYFSNIEIRSVIDFVRKGGSLLAISEYGADYLQKTNLNDITGKYFGIYFQKNLVKIFKDDNQNCSSILKIQHFQEHKITNQLRDLTIGGSCSLLIDKNVEQLIYLDGSWTEIYNDASKVWLKDEEGKRQILAACTEYGRGRVLAIGDIDIFSNDNNIGLNSFDNYKFITNIIDWLSENVEDKDVLGWILHQLGIFQNEFKEVNIKINNLIETITVLEKRISSLEDNPLNNNQEDLKK